MRSLRLLLPVALIVVAPLPARADYACVIPRALLCENCAKDISIVVGPSGACRVTFTPGEANPTPAAGNLPIRVSVAPPVYVRPAVVRRAPRWPRIARVQLNPPRSSKCFVFNGARYCE
jgi:hypothetical protein